MVDCFVQAPLGAKYCSPGWSASGTLGSRSRSKSSPSPRARGEGWGEGRELRKREQNSRFAKHNRQDPRLRRNA